MTKSEFAKTVSREKIVRSIYGFWSDYTNSIKLKISPSGNFTRIKIIAVNDISSIERIAFYCGLQLPPKRKDWKGFNFITHLEKVNSYCYVDGMVHMPLTSRQNRVNMTVVGLDCLSLDFYFIETKNGTLTQKAVGSLILKKEVPVTEHVAPQFLIADQKQSAR